MTSQEQMLLDMCRQQRDSLAVQNNKLQQALSAANNRVSLITLLKSLFSRKRV